VHGVARELNSLKFLDIWTFEIASSNEVEYRIETYVVSHRAKE